MSNKQQEHACQSWQRLRNVAAEELADYLEVETPAADDLIQEQFYRVRVSVMVWDESGVPVFDTQCGSLDENGELRIPPLNFSEGVGWHLFHDSPGLDPQFDEVRRLTAVWLEERKAVATDERREGRTDG